MDDEPILFYGSRKKNDHLSMAVTRTRRKSFASTPKPCRSFPADLQTILTTAKYYHEAVALSTLVEDITDL